MKQLYDRISANRDMLTRRIALGAVILAATVLSYSTLQHRAHNIGLPFWATWFYPVLYDSFILGASRTWQNPEASTSTRRLAAGATVAAILAAIAAFVAEFLPFGGVAVLFAIAIPIFLALALTITTKAARDRVTAESDAEPQKKAQRVQTPKVKPEPTEDDVYPQPQTLLQKQTSAEERKQWIRMQLAEGVMVTGAMVDKQFPGGSRNGARLVKQVQSERKAS